MFEKGLNEEFDSGLFLFHSGSSLPDKDVNTSEPGLRLL
jgi:hypothetical protein